MQMKRYLAIDTSAGYLTVIAKNGETFVTFEPDCAMQHSVRLMDAVEETLAKAGLKPADCDFFCAVTGARLVHGHPHRHFHRQGILRGAAQARIGGNLVRGARI